MNRSFNYFNLWVVLLLPLFAVITGCQKDEAPPITVFSLSNSEVQLVAGDTYRLSLTIEPENYLSEKVIWSSSAPTVATVSDNGEIKALSGGEATITAKLNDKQASAKVVVSRFVAVDKVVFSANGYTVFMGASFKAEATILPADATMRNVEWSIADATIATIDKSGTVKPLKVGATDILFKIQDKTFKTTLLVKDRIKVLNKDLRVMVGGKILIEIDKNFADYGKESIHVDIDNAAILLQTDSKTLTFTGIKPGKAKLKLSTTHAEGEFEIEVIYPQNLLFPNMEWGKKLDVIKIWEQEHGGKPDGDLTYDDDLWMDYQNFKVETTPMQPVPFRRYYFDEDALSKSFVLYPYVLCFDDKGGGMGNFSPEFLALLKKEGYSEPQSTGKAFLCINTEKKLWLVIDVQKYDEGHYFGLTFMQSPY